jgi:glycosyltransferase involved in cell wall biosynthesis
MRILVVTNLYPPHYHGGYEVRCAQVAEALQSAGHTVLVLTSGYGIPQPNAGRTARHVEEQHGIQIHRSLNQYLYPPQPTGRPWRLGQARRELADVREFVRVAKTFRPDIVNWWSMYGLSKLLLPMPGRWGIPDVHWIEHGWRIEDSSREGENPAAFWGALWDGRWGPRPVRPLLRLLARVWKLRVQKEDIPTRDFPNQPTHVCFVSEHMRAIHQEAGLTFPSSEIIHGGVPVEQFYQAPRAPRSNLDQLRVLYVGQLTPDRGLHTVLEALALLDSPSRSRMTLSVAGVGQVAYERQVKEQVESLRLNDCVTFMGRVSHGDMPGLYKGHDLLVFPSMRDEGLPLTMVEAMLAGCAVVTTGSGGAMEVATAADLPLFPKGDAGALSRLLETMAAHPEKVHELAARGQAAALRDFSFDRMMERWLVTLRRIHGDASARDRVGGLGRRMASELP